MEASEPACAPIRSSHSTRSLFSALIVIPANGVRSQGFQP
jgi:hypothetical protein